MASIQLLIADSTNLVLGALLGPQWGIYYQGQPVIMPATIFNQTISGALAPIASVASLLGLPNILPVTASMVEFHFKQDWPVSNYPQEQGAFQSYDKVTLPFDVRTRLACSGPSSVRQAFIQAILAIAGSKLPNVTGLPINIPTTTPSASSELPRFSVVTPELTYASCSCVHVDFARTAEKGVSMIVADMWWQEISVTASSSLQNPKNPVNAGPVPNGNIQPSNLPLGGGLTSAGNFLSGFNPAKVM
jgi:hypothetical protein